MKKVDRALEWENGVVLTISQALLGLISERVDGVSVEIDGKEVTVHFAVSELDESIREDIDDIIADIEGLMWPLTPEVSSRVFVGLAREGWPGQHYRMVFLRKM